MRLIEKYPPLTFDDLIIEDQSVRSELRDFATRRRTNHIILDGTNGVGKSITARVIARMQFTNAELAEDLIYQAGGYNPYQSADAKANLQTNTFYRSQAGWADFYCVLNEADRLTNAQQHKLLAAMDKPTHLGYHILTTNHCEKLSRAIVSRSDRYTLRPPNPKTLLPLCQKILFAEGVHIPDDRILDLLACTDCTFRQVNSMLERTICELIP